MLGLRSTVEAEVELFATNEERVVDIPRNDIGFVHVESLEGSVEIGPRHDLLELVDLLQQKDAISLRLVIRLDNPRRIGILLELIKEDSVLICMSLDLLGKVKVSGKKSICAPPQTSSFARKCSFF